MSGLVLSLFPGIGLLDMAFEEEGFCVVRGPDLLWGGDIKRFHPPAGRFDGVIGGPPCQQFSQVNQAARMGLTPLAANLIPEFERCIAEAHPSWFAMENVRQAPLPAVRGYVIQDVLFNNREVGGVQNRIRRFSFGTHAGARLPIEFHALEPADYEPCVTANGTQWQSERSSPTPSGKRKGFSRSDRSARALIRYIAAQGLPVGFLDDAPFTVEGKVRVVGNGVPLAMGRAVAKAVRRAIGSLALEAAE